MKNIRNKLTFKALTLREAAREKALAFRAKALDTTGEGYVDTAVKSLSPLLSALCSWLDWSRFSTRSSCPE